MLLSSFSICAAHNKAWHGMAVAYQAYETYEDMKWRVYKYSSTILIYDIFFNWTGSGDYMLFISFKFYFIFIQVYWNDLNEFLGNFCRISTGMHPCLLPWPSIERQWRAVLAGVLTIRMAGSDKLFSLEKIIPSSSSSSWDAYIELSRQFSIISFHLIIHITSHILFPLQFLIETYYRFIITFYPWN